MWYKFKMLNSFETESIEMSEEATTILAEFAASLTYEAIPERVRDYCKDLLLDALACAVAGHAGEETHQLAALSAALAQSRESTVIGGDRLSLAGATMLNGYLITAVTMCDAHRPTMTHITPEVVPPALAIGERDALCGRELLVALAAGFEVTTRIGIGVDFPEFRARGWHGPGIFGRPPPGLRYRHDGAGVRSRRQPGRRHLRGLGDADGEIPSVPRRLVGADGSAARGREIPRDPRVPHRARRRALQQLRERRASGSRRRGSRHALGTRTDCIAPVARGLLDPGHDDCDVRYRGKAKDRSRAGEDVAHRTEPARL